MPVKTSRVIYFTFVKPFASISEVVIINVVDYLVVVDVAVVRSKLHFV